MEVEKLLAAISNRARAIEVKTTRAIGLMNQYGQLHPINKYESVAFYHPTDSNVPFVKCDGLIKTANSVILLNSVKASPEQENIDEVESRVKLLEKVLLDLSRFVSVSPLTAGILDDIKQVVPFLSGCDFPIDVIDECHKAGINTVETNGSDYTVNMHSSPAPR
jgi:hypothetical protein